MQIAQTNRLILSKITVDDAPFILELMNTPGWLKYIGDRNIKTVEDAAESIKKTNSTVMSRTVMDTTKCKSKQKI
jgi:hypothetical protein